MQKFIKWLKDNNFIIISGYSSIGGTMTFKKDNIEFYQGKCICNICRTQNDLIIDFREYLK